MADDFVLTCQCGKHLKIPADKEGKKIRCPGCKVVIVAERPAPAAPRCSGGVGMTRILVFIGSAVAVFAGLELFDVLCSVIKQRFLDT